MTPIRPVFLALAAFLSCVVAELLPIATLAADIPRPEYPRPQLRRDDWLNLNGEWRFRFDPGDVGIAEKWAEKTVQFDRRITVPFCWESRLSGIADTSGQQIGWYARTVDIPAAWKGRRVWLCFGAVDQRAQVWVDGKHIGNHQGGYSPFSFDITESASLASNIEVVVRAFDATDPELPLGKQGGRWFTPTSGIWQTVWLEARGATRVQQVHMVPRRRENRWSVGIELEIAGDDGPAAVTITSPDSGVEMYKGTIELSQGRGLLETDLAIVAPKIWSPEQPHLYDLDIVVRGADGQTDTVHTYFGLRTISRGGYEGIDRQVILLNGRPTYLRGALDHSFNPEGIYTAPDDDFIRRDMELARAAGFNMLRIHVKADDPRRLYWADRMGMLLVQDMPCAMKAGRRTRKAWQSTMEATVLRDRNHPSIIAWCLFNEDWGLEEHRNKSESVAKNNDTHKWVREMFDRVKNHLDPWRLVETNTPGRFDRHYSDYDSWQFAIDDFGWARENIDKEAAADRNRGGPPLLNMRFSPLPLDGGDRDVSRGFRNLVTQLRRHDTVGGYVYGQLYDVEWQHDGLLNYDRSPKEFGYDAFVRDMTTADLQGEDFIGFDGPPLLEVAPGGQFVLPVFVSHFSKRDREPILRWRIAGTNDQGMTFSTEVQEAPVNWRPNQATIQKPLRCAAPDGPSLVGAVVLELVDHRGERIAANFANLIVRRATFDAQDVPETAIVRTPTEQHGPAIEVINQRLAALRFDVGDFAAFTSDRPAWDWIEQRGKFIAHGKCEVEYHLKLPKFIRRALPNKVMLIAEMATKSNGRMVDWPSARRPEDCPQTQQRKFPGGLSVRLAGEEILALELPDDPSDSRGVLSWQSGYQPGSYGFLVRKRADLTQMVSLRDTLADRDFVPLVFQATGEGSGLSLYGPRQGRYCIRPTILVQTARDMDKGSGWSSPIPITTHRLLDRSRLVSAVDTAVGEGHDWRMNLQRPSRD